MLVFLVPILYAFANLADKFLVDGDDDDADPGALLALSGLFSGLFAILFALFIFLTGRSFGDVMSIVMLIGIGGLYYAAMWIYLDMLKVDDSSSVTAWFQVIPMFGAIGAFFILKEMPTWYQIIAIIFLVIGGFMLSYRDGELNKTIIFWMIVSAALVASYDVLFADYGRDIDEFSAIMYMLIGKMIAGFIFLAIDKKAQRGFWIGLTTKIKAQFVSESVNCLADIAIYACMLSMPVLLVQGVSSLQPMFVLVGAMIFGKFFPEIEEDTEGVNLYRKVGGLILMITGGIFLV